jgi:hypothetical protein
LLPHHEAPIAPLDQQRATEHQALFGAGEAEIVVTAVFTETPNLGVIFVPLLVIYRFLLLVCQF